MLTIRPALKDDLKVITHIYNQAIIRTTATFDTEPKTFNEMMKWFAQHGTTHPVIVAEDNEVVGWASLSKWSERCAYDGTVELSFYVDENHRGKGIGKNLLHHITEEGRKRKFHTIISRITEDNEVSIKLHLNEGYKITGTLFEAGKKFGKYLDVLFYQIIFKEND